MVINLTQWSIKFNGRIRYLTLQGDEEHSTKWTQVYVDVIIVRFTATWDAVSL